MADIKVDREQPENIVTVVQNNMLDCVAGDDIFIYNYPNFRNIRPRIYTLKADGLSITEEADGESVPVDLVQPQDVHVFDSIRLPENITIGGLLKLKRDINAVLISIMIDQGMGKAKY